MSRETKQISETIHNIFVDEWDPIGVNELLEAQNEYDNYIGGVQRLLKAGADKEKIISHLRHLETVSMGLPDRDDTSRERVAEMLLQLVVKKNQ